MNKPSQDVFKGIAKKLNFTMSEEELDENYALMSANFAMLDWLESQPDAIPPVKYPRTPGYEPTGADNEFNAWAQKVSIKGASSGKLAGRQLVLKDNIAVAGVPMTNGTTVLRKYLPDMDATVVTRVLDAGAEIVGKAKCEYYSLTGNSHTHFNLNKVQNPYKPGHTSGGSSSGCGALVGGGVVSLAIGADQGGSVRVPASHCGCVAMKPTHGLVPYTGAATLDFTVDHLGPITGNVADNALLLEVIAGPDGFDPRQQLCQTQVYTDFLDRELKGLKIGVLREGFGHPESDPAVDANLRQTMEVLASAGAIVTEISIPEHLQAIPVWWPIAYQGFYDFGFERNGLGTNYQGLYNLSLAEAQATWRQKTGELSRMTKYLLLLGHYLTHECRGKYYALAQNYRRVVTAAYDRALADVDVIAMPTLPFVAPPIPEQDASLLEYVTAAGNMAVNTICQDLTGHPAITVPSGMHDGLPIGAMFVGRKFDEGSLYQVAANLERLIDWKRTTA